MDDFAPALESWRVVRVAGREMIDAVVAPEHRTPSPMLARALADWPGTHYWCGTDRRELVLIRTLAAPRRERWALHLALLLVTLICMLGAGAALAGRWYPRADPLADSAWPTAAAIAGPFLGGAYFFADLVRDGWGSILVGWSFAVPLCLILLVHELGHYAAARRYAIDTSPPFFIPVPPTLSPIGSLGAFLRLRSPVLDRRQLLDVGAAGPVAGFVVALVVLAWGYAISTPVAVGDPAGPFVVFAGQVVPLGDSLLTLAAGRLFHPGAPALHLSLPAFAGWVGAFITGLNLLPLSQLDGGHVLYGLLGKRQAAVGLACIVGLIGLAQLSWSWYVWVVLALLIGRGGWSHPSVLVPERPITGWRLALGWLCVAIFVATFVPVPFRI